MIHKLFMLAIALCLLQNQILAQKKVYSLREVLQKTVEQYPSLSSKKYDIEQQQLRKELVKKEQLPDVNFQAQQSYGSYQGVSGAFFPLAGIYNTSGNNKGVNGQSSSVSNAYTSAVLQWDFLQFGRIKSKLQVADAAIKVSTSALSQEELRLQSIAAEQYFNVLQSTAFLLTAKADVQRLKELFELSKAQADAGLRPGADTLLIKSNYYQIRGQVNQQQALFETAMLQLSSLLGEDTSSFSIDTSVYNANNIAFELPLDDSLGNHPYLQYLKANIQYANASLAAVKRLPYPSVGLLAGAGLRGSGINNVGEANNGFAEPWKNNTAGYLVGVGVTWKLSWLYQNKTRQRIAEKEIQAANANYEDANLQVKTSYAAAISRWKQQRERVMDAHTALNASKQACELYVTRYESGLINLIELLQLQKTLQDAENNYVTATAAYWNELINQSESTGSLSMLLSQINP
ncbi:TolC family protein [Segetibacter koreensis]|uniref:TolC family protein n=1 Tax=Segetibacter koreensis TaxID=398037 RepID=UPI00047783D0|nr:TolC family protein [Segetibacter koreensis]